MCFTQNDNPLSRREVAGLRLRPEGQRDLDTTDRVGYWHQDWKAVAVDPRRLHHDAIDRLISIELKRPSHEGAGEVEADIRGENESEQPTRAGALEHRHLLPAIL
jgi:hypothetical protein